jgi:hypothetical protein
VSERGKLVYAESSTLEKILGIADMRAAKEIFFNSAIDKGVKLTQQQKDLMEQIANDITKAGLDQAANSAEASGLHGFAKLNFDESTAIQGIQTDKSLSTEQQEIKEYAVRYTFSQMRIALEQQESDKTIALRQHVVDETLSGTVKILADEAAAVAQLTTLHQRNGTDDAQFQQQKVLIHQNALNQIAASERQSAAEIAAIQDKTRDTFLSGDDLIFAQQEEAVTKAREEYEKAPNPAAWEKYQAEIVLADAEAQKKLRDAHQATADQDAADLQKRTLEFNKLNEEQTNAQSATALAMVPPWQKAYAQINDEENKRLLKIQTDEDALKAKYADDAGMLAQIDATSQAERAQVWAETNEKIHAENQRLTEQLGSDLQSVFDDMTSGNIGKRILANMEKLFFQIVAQWILSLNLMKSQAGSIFGSIIFGPGSTGANVFGGGAAPGTSILGSLFGLGGSSSGGGLSATPPGINDPGFGGFGDFSATVPTTSTTGISSVGLSSALSSSSSSSSVFSALSDSTNTGLPGAIAGTSSSTSGGLLPSASNALSTITMSDALNGGAGGGAPGVVGGASKAGGIFSLFSGNNIASLSGLGLATAGSALGGKTGQIGGLLMGLLLSGHLAPVLSSLFGTIGLGATGALAGGLAGGLIGFGVGQGHGGLLGSLAGAGSGALTGFLVGGPVGAIVGGIVGLLGGIFGGIFGASKRKKQATALADNTLIPDITQISTSFDGFQTDSSSAIQQLEQLRTDSQKQLSALQSQDVFNQKVNPAIDAAEQHIKDTQAERDRRSAQVFGPPQFDTGGMFVMRGGNAGLAVLHDGEAVINPTATKKNMNAIATMNAGGTVGSSFGDLHIHTQTVDRAYIMGSQFRKDFLAAKARWANEGKG